MKNGFPKTQKRQEKKTHFQTPYKFYDHLNRDKIRVRDVQMERVRKNSMKTRFYTTFFTLIAAFVYCRRPCHSISIREDTHSLAHTTKETMNEMCYSFLNLLALVFFFFRRRWIIINQLNATNRTWFLSVIRASMFFFFSFKRCYVEIMEFLIKIRWNIQLLIKQKLYGYLIGLHLLT